MHKLINNLLILILSVLSGTAYAGLEADKPTVLITGANRGIGLEFVRQYSALDWNIIATVRNPRKAKALKALANEDPNIIIE
ncbi:MAG: SDR family NAD(P)-dependent oxidoreductase [Gammaproteobacteria bacterium]|nr:SDR family NAD(P)-dependent oxidoreductase [Gammaproteobacteria bacterium]